MQRVSNLDRDCNVTARKGIVATKSPDKRSILCVSFKSMCAGLKEGNHCIDILRHTCGPCVVQQEEEKNGERVQDKNGISNVQQEQEEQHPSYGGTS